MEPGLGNLSWWPLRGTPAIWVAFFVAAVIVLGCIALALFALMSRTRHRRRGRSEVALFAGGLAAFLLGLAYLVGTAELS